MDEQDPEEMVDKPPKPLGTVMELEERRRKEFELRIMGHTLKQIGDVVGVDPSVVSRDLRTLQEQVLANLRPRRIHRMVADALLRYNVVLSKAMLDYDASPKGSQPRIRALEVALQANTACLKFIQEMGIVKRMPQLLEVSILDHPALQGLTPEQRVRVGRGLLKFFMLVDGFNGENEPQLLPVEPEQDEEPGEA